jgi:hypothetical protein
MTARIALRRYDKPAEFVADVEPWLMSAEDSNHQLIAIAHLLLTKDHPFRDPLFLASIRNGDALAGCAISAAPDGIELTALPAGAAEALVPMVAAVRPTLPWVSGPPAAALEFESAWRRQTGRASGARHDFDMMRLDEVITPRPVPGGLRLAEERDWPVLREWSKGYTKDTQSPVDVTAFFDRRLRRRELHVWDHDGLKGMVAASRGSPNSIVITAVYTPDAHRRRGYASNGVAEVSRRALASGVAFCVMGAERQASNVYRAIGYRLVRDQAMIELL